MLGAEIRKVGGISLAMACVLACRRAPSPGPRELAFQPEASGCVALVRTRKDGKEMTGCALSSERLLRVFVPGLEGRVEFSARGQPFDATLTRRAGDGELYAVTIRPAVEILDVRRTSTDGARWVGTIGIVPSPRPAWYAEAQALRQSGKLAEAEAKAEGGAGSDLVTERAAAEGLLARIALRRGQLDEAIRRFGLALDLDERAGLVSDRADDAFALAFMLHQRARRYGEAERVLADVRPHLASYPDGWAREPLYAGQLAWARGDTRDAMTQMATAMARAERLGLGSVRRAAQEVRGMVACTAGSTRECVRSLREAERELTHANDATDCQRAEVLVSLGYAELEEAQTMPEEAHPTLGQADTRALALLGQSCPDKYLHALAYEHLAMAAALAKDAAAARRHLADAKSFAPEPRIDDAILWLCIEGAIAELERTPSKALAAFDAALALARASDQRRYQWRALLGRARVLEAQGKNRDALAALLEAEAVLDDLVLLVPLGEGRSGVASDGAESFRRAALLLLADGNASGALERIRHARGRVLRGLSLSARIANLEGSKRQRWNDAVASYREARAAIDEDAATDWKKSRAALDVVLRERTSKLATLRQELDQAMQIVSQGAPLRPPAWPEDETVLAFARLGAHVWGFVKEAKRTRAFRVESWDHDAPEEVLSQRLLEPAAGEITRAKRIRIVATEELLSVDIHALPLHGQPLLARAPVVYGTEVPEGATLAERPGERGLVVADPTADLPSARQEGSMVSAAWAPYRAVDTIVGSDATSARVLEALPRATFFHYAGHATFQGREGAETSLPLASGSALTLADVFTLRRAPLQVVLSACESGRQTAASHEQAANMAHAFLMVGTDTVVAPVRNVGDDAARQLGRNLYVPRDGGLAVDLAVALRDAQLLAARDNVDGWKAFRAFVR